MTAVAGKQIASRGLRLLGHAEVCVHTNTPVSGTVNLPPTFGADPAAGWRRYVIDGNTTFVFSALPSTAIPVGPGTTLLRTYVYILDLQIEAPGAWTINFQAPVGYSVQWNNSVSAPSLNVSAGARNRLTFVQLESESVFYGDLVYKSA